MTKIRFILQLICYPFFDQKWLSGRHFSGDVLRGYKWCLLSIWHRKILRLGPMYPFPVHHSTEISRPENISFHIDNLDNFQSPNCYYQNFQGHITIGYGCYIARNVGFITSNHDLENLDDHRAAKDIVIGSHCWIGMNSVILPGVTLADHTVVAAGSVVNKSVSEDRCVLAGVPAKIVKRF